MRTIGVSGGGGASRSRVALTAVVCCAGAMWIGACGSDDSASDSPSTATAAEAGSASTPATDAPTTVEPAATADGTLVTEPTPQKMCPAGSWPRTAAYDIDTGAFQWASCTDQRAWQSVIHASDEAVYMWSPLVDPEATIALDPQSGEELPSAPPPPAEAFGDRSGAPTVVEVDGAQVTGGQGGPVTVRFDDGTSWTQPGRWAYGDVYGIGDGAVFAVESEPTTRLVGYELETGDVRWAHEGDVYVEGLWPWKVADGRLYTLWSNMQVRSTEDGSLIWATDYPVEMPEDGFLEPSPEAPRMSGVAVGDDLVYVSFATAASGGD